MGRQLASFDGITYTYNENGIRTSKTVNNVTTTYYLDGTNIIEQITGNTVLHFYYDSNDEVIGFEYNSDNYYYVKNAMGDILGIADSAGNLMASYAYDPWGKVLSITGSDIAIGNLNPFRYRGYYYDAETGLYYLQSRYYDPEVGRFINCDDVNYIGITESEISYNPFAYCENEPVNNKDSNGYFINAVIGSVFGAAFGALEAKLTKSNVKYGAITGAISGFISGLGVDIAIATGGTIGTLISAALGATASVISKLITYYLNHNFTIKKLKQKSVIKELAYAALLGALFNVVGYSWTKSLNYGNPPKGYKTLRSLIYSLKLNVQDVRNSAMATAALAHILGLKQTVINGILGHIKK